MSIRFAILLALAPVLSGCAAESAGDPVLVGAETTIQSSFDTLNGFVIYDNQMRQQLKGTPVHAMAENVRRTFPAVFAAAMAADQAYRASPSAANQLTLQKSAAAMAALADGLAVYLQYGAAASIPPAVTQAATQNAAATGVRP